MIMSDVTLLSFSRGASGSDCFNCHFLALGKNGNLVYLPIPQSLNICLKDEMYPNAPQKSQSVINQLASKTDQEFH